MIAIPYTSAAIPEGTFNLILIMTERQVPRLYKADPAIVDITKVIAELAEPFNKMKLNALMIAHEDDAGINRVVNMVRSHQSVKELLDFLQRGFTPHPEDDAYDPTTEAH